MHARLRPLHLIANLSVVMAAASAVSGCKDPPPGKLFDEQGAWAVVQYDLGEGLEDIMAMSRKDAFMISFNTDASVMTTAACGNEMSSFEPNESPCLTQPGSTSWLCSCYSYAFQEDVMQMTPFEAGSPPPPVEFDPELIPGQSGEAGGVDTGTGGSGSGSGGSGGGETGGAAGPISVIRVSAIPEKRDTYDFTPLPSGVFGGNGANHHFIVEARSTTLFSTVYDDPKGRPSCEPCIPGVMDDG